MISGDPWFHTEFLMDTLQSLHNIGLPWFVKMCLHQKALLFFSLTLSLFLGGVRLHCLLLDYEHHYFHYNC
jgi:hypothetical protein